MITKSIKKLVKFAVLSVLTVLYIGVNFLLLLGIGVLEIEELTQTLVVVVGITFVGLGSALFLGHIDKAWKI